ncbi:MAG: hypothetical protein FJX47_17705, partial [Alphaproteobacteria bacterium]|nr:hypothetical protein [Alphaproteobacteria bacterium]
MIHRVATLAVLAFLATSGLASEKRDPGHRLERVEKQIETARERREDLKREADSLATEAERLRERAIQAA